MRLIGIDPGSVITGFGLVERIGAECVHVAHGTLRPPKSASLARRMAFLYEGLLRTLDLHEPDAAAIQTALLAIH